MGSVVLDQGLEVVKIDRFAQKKVGTHGEGSFDDVHIAHAADDDGKDFIEEVAVF